MSTTGILVGMPVDDVVSMLAAPMNIHSLSYSVSSVLSVSIVRRENGLSSSAPKCESNPALPRPLWLSDPAQPCFGLGWEEICRQAGAQEAHLRQRKRCRARRPQDEEERKAKEPQG